MPDPTDIAFERLRGGAAVADPTEAAFAKMQASSAAQLSALREPDPGTIDVQYPDSSRPQQSTTAGPPRQDFGLGAAKDREVMNSIPMQAAKEYAGHLWDTTVKPPLETMKRWFTDPGVQREKQAAFEEAQASRGMEKLPQINVMPAEIASAMGLPLTRNPLTGRMEGPRASQPSDAQSAVLPAPGASWGSQVTRNIGEVPGVAFGVQPEVLAMNAAFAAPAAAVDQSRAEGVDPGVVGGVLGAPQKGTEAVFGTARKFGARAAQGAVEAVNRPTMEDVTSSSQYRRPLEERGIGPVAGGVAELAAGVPIFGAAERALAKTPSLRQFVRGKPVPDISKPPAFDIPEAKVEPAPSPAKPAEAPPSPPPKTVRLFRVEGAAGKGTPGWMKENESVAGTPEAKQAAARGAWYAETPENVEWYKQDAGPGAKVYSVDVPADVAERYRVSNLPDTHEARRYSRRPAEEFFLPLEVQKTRVEVPSPHPASGQAPAAPTPEPIPPRYREDPFRPGVMVNQYGRALPDKPAWYREMAPESLEELLLGNRTIGEYHGWFADSPDLALGQGRGASGIKVKFDRELGLNATTFKKGAKPGIGMTGLTEMEMNLPYRDAYNAIREVTIPKEHLKGTRLGRMWNRRLRPDLEQAGFTIEDNGKTLVARRSPAAPSAPDVPGVPPPQMGNRRIGGGGPEAGAVRIPTGKEVVQAYDTAEATGQKAYQAVTHPIADAVSKIADAVPGVKRLRQWGIHDSLAIDPSERLYQAHERRIGRIEEGRRQAELGARALDRATSNLGSYDATEVGKYMDGERPDLPAAAKPQQAAIDLAVADMHQTRTEMLNRKIISQAVYDEYPRFLSRIYRVMAREGRTGFGAAKIAKLSEELYRQDAHGVVVSLPEAEAAMVAQPHSPKVVTGTNAQTLLKFETPQAREAFVNDVQAWDAARKGRGPGAKEGLVIERFEPLSADVRETLGEITSPGDRFAMTLAKARAKIATHDLLASMETMGKGQPGGDWIMPGPGSPGVKGTTGPVLPNYTRVTGRGWGPLEGKYLRNDIHEYATSIVDGSSADAVSSALRGAYGQWKFDRTVGSIPTVMRNLLSSHWMSVEAGVNYLNPRNWPAWKEAIETLAGRNEARRKWATENGVITNDFYSREFKARVDRALAGNDNPVTAVWEALKASKDETLSQTAQQKIINRGASAAGEAAVNPLTAVPGAQTVKRAMGTIYSWENNSRRLAAAIKLERQGLSMTELLKKLDRITENYGRQGGAQQLAQNVPLIGPFARFTWERYRIFKNNLVDHPVVVGETLLYSYLLKKALEAHFGKNVTDEEHKAVEQEFGHQTVAMDPDETGKVRTYDPRWTFPYGQVMAGPETDRNAGEEGRAWMNYAARILGGGLAPGIEPIMALTKGKDSSGKPVADSFTRSRLGPAGTGGEIWRQYIGPPIFGRYFDQFDAAMHGQPISSRQPVQSPEDVVLGYLTGVSLGKLDINVARKNLETIFQARESEVIGDAKKRILGGGKSGDIKTEAKSILAPLKESLQGRKRVLGAAAQSRADATDAAYEKAFGKP